ncbi:MAG: ribonuclease H-like domain-containing protein [Saprospiraceae bacterium]|nr:ribonuclease H-like domain-containing protein [Saprospiraceae bacterium]HMW40277.1 ribonuclease H-like domain-containing protein [Saprospiraceae bacterium]HMX87274.1 ribonuclease H-like domain-containing protein [Saprospiraceae bacterium]HMZ40757.1 ribonuclease H-like domain-containing protein [Saprospiraceae bacterium]HNA64891.1 ribonuclease H-like domain-containing protein [Saprospiraceae bacterium]
MSRNEIYIDAEWYIGGDVFLIGYASHDKDHGQLYDSYLNVRHFNKLIREKLYIYVYGPDIGVLEKFYGINLRDNFICVNLLKIFRRHIKARSYKLADIEKMFGIRRNRTEYKKSIFEIWNDWHRPAKRERILEYNQEDVINLIKLWKIIREEYEIDDEYLLKNRLL